MVYKTIDVEVELSDFTDDELLKELRDRNVHVNTNPEEPLFELVEAVWAKRRLGLPYENELNQLIFDTIGKIV
jgi:hypothetical protein